VVRTIAEVANYAYSVSDKGLWLNLYGSNNVSTVLKDGSKISMSQQTNYPWDGNIKLILNETGPKPYSIFLRIPAWTDNAQLLVNGKPSGVKLVSGQYAELNRKWKKGDKVEMILPMEAKLIESNPLVEENRNQVAVKRGPVVYCLESVDMPDQKIFNVFVPSTIILKAQSLKIDNADVMSLEGEAKLVESKDWKNVLYREVSDQNKTTKIRMVPYFAWGNRGHSEMSVWLPLSR
jgi:hypothetical protein